MNELLSDLHKQRQTLVALQEQKRAALAEFQAQHQELFDLLTTQELVVSDLEAEVRRLTLEAYAADPTNKHPFPGCHVRIGQHMTLGSASAVYHWCRENAPLMLIVDTKRFEKAVRTGLFSPPPDVATVAEEPQATIATDLGKVFGS